MRRVAIIEVLLLGAFLSFISACTQELRIITADITWKYDTGMGILLYNLKKDTIIYSTVWDTVGYLSTNGSIIKKVCDSTYKKHDYFHYHCNRTASTLILDDTCCNGTAVSYLQEKDRYHKSLDFSHLVGVCSGGIIDEELKSSVTLLKLRGGKKIKIIWDDKGDIGMNYVNMLPYKDKLIIEYEKDEHRYIAMVDLHAFSKKHNIKYDWDKNMSGVVK